MAGQPSLSRPLYSRRQIVTMLQACFYTLHQYSIKSRRAKDSDSSYSYNDMRGIIQNFTMQIKCVLEYI